MSPSPLDESLGKRVFPGRVWSDLAQSLLLSDRELQIVQGVFDDAKDSVIAERIGISQHTVHTHFERLYHKLEVHSRPALIVRIVAEYRHLTDGGDHRGRPSK